WPAPRRTAESAWPRSGCSDSPSIPAHSETPRIPHPATPARGPLLPFRTYSSLCSSRRLVVESGLHDPGMRERRIEPIDAAVRVLRAAQVHFGIVAAVLGPQAEVAARQLDVELPQPRQPVHPAA